jgi:hypothetical protein
VLVLVLALVQVLVQELEPGQIQPPLNTKKTIFESPLLLLVVVETFATFAAAVVAAVVAGFSCPPLRSSSSQQDWK